MDSRTVRQNHQKLNHHKSGYNFGAIHVEVTRDVNVVSGRRQNVGKPTALEQPVSSGMIERCISIGDLLATAECENRSGSNKWSAAHRPNENEISHGGVSWQTRWSCIAIGPLASLNG